MQRETQGSGQGPPCGDRGRGGLTPCPPRSRDGGDTGGEELEEEAEAKTSGEGGNCQLPMYNGKAASGGDDLPQPERTTCYFKGYKYARAWASQRKIVYRCSKYRTGCKGKMEYSIASMGYASVRGHTCRDNLIEATTIRDVEDEMKAAADHLAVEHRDWRARDVWEKLR